MMKLHFNSNEYKNIIDLLDASESRIINYNGMIIQDLSHPDDPELDLVCAYCSEILSGSYHWFSVICN